MLKKKAEEKKLSGDSEKGKRKNKKKDNKQIDDEMIDKKEKAKSEVESLLNYRIENGGSNLSSGEKALICICRAVLRKSKIVILDEATATVDLMTEQAIQKLISERFKDCTMLIIAHRLQTIIDADKVLVLGDGVKREFGAPAKLLENSDSHFSKLVARMKDQDGPRQ